VEGDYFQQVQVTIRPEEDSSRLAPSQKTQRQVQEDFFSTSSTDAKSGSAGGLFSTGSTEKKASDTSGGLFSTSSDAKASSGGLFSTGADKTKAGGLFSTGDKKDSSGGGLFSSGTDSKAAGGLFSTTATTEKKDSSGGGLFSTGTAKPAGGGLFSTDKKSDSGGLFSTGATTTGEKKTAGGGLFGTSSTTATTVKSRVEGKTLEDCVAIWREDLREHAASFSDQSAVLKRWDAQLFKSIRQIKALQKKVVEVSQTQQSLGNKLDQIAGQQDQLEAMLDELENHVKTQAAQSGGKFDVLGSEDLKRDFIFCLAEELNMKLHNMNDKLNSTIVKLNQATEGQRGFPANHPVVKVINIMNAHMRSLQWMEAKTDDLAALLNVPGGTMQS